MIFFIFEIFTYDKIFRYISKIREKFFSNALLNFRTLVLYILFPILLPLERVSDGLAKTWSKWEAISRSNVKKDVYLFNTIIPTEEPRRIWISKAYVNNLGAWRVYASWFHGMVSKESDGPSNINYLNKNILIPIRSCTFESLISNEYTIK